MKHNFHLPPLLLSLCTLAPLLAQPPAPEAAREGVPQSALDSREERMSWWRDAKFGMFVHYGLYSGLAGKLNKKSYPGCVEWIQQQSGASTLEYLREAFGKFVYKKGNAEKWVALAKEAGCKYIVMTTRHHEGFNLYDTSYISNFSSINHYGVDIVREFSQATVKHGLKTGYYFSVIDWNHPDYDPTGSAISYPQGNYRAQKEGHRQFGNHARYKKHLHALFERLVSRYPTDIIWWDFSSAEYHGDHAWGASKLMSTLFKHHPKAVQNNRLYYVGNNLKSDGFKITPTHMGDFTTPEHYIPASGVKGDWEVCNTLNGTWGYSAENQNWVKPEKVIRDLVDIVSRGGNYLLNIGPMPDGSIPEQSIKIFTEVGAWMKLNGEAIYGTQASPFNVEFPWGRITRKGEDTLYLIVYSMPEKGIIELPRVLGEQMQAHALLDAKQQFPLTRTDKATRIDISKLVLSPSASVVKLSKSQ